MFEIRQTGNIETEHDIYEDFETPGPKCERNEDGDKPIQPGHWLSLKSAVLLIGLYAIVHSLTASEISDLLTLINLFLIQGNQVFKGLYLFKRLTFLNHHL